MRIKNKELRRRRHRKEQTIKKALKAQAAEFADKPKVARAVTAAPAKGKAPKATVPSEQAPTEIAAESAPEAAKPAAERKRKPKAEATETESAPAKAPARKKKTPEPDSE